MNKIIKRIEAIDGETTKSINLAFKVVYSDNSEIYLTFEQVEEFMSQSTGQARILKLYNN